MPVRAALRSHSRRSAHPIPDFLERPEVADIGWYIDQTSVAISNEWSFSPSITKPTATTVYRRPTPTRTPYIPDPPSPAEIIGKTVQNKSMELEFSRGELAILHCLRDGNDPYAMLSGADPIQFAHDVDRLLQLSMIQRSGSLLALTVNGLSHLDEPRNSGPMPLDDYDV